jgi:hypothetical protein
LNLKYADFKQKQKGFSEEKKGWTATELGRARDSRPAHLRIPGAKVKKSNPTGGLHLSVPKLNKWVPRAIGHPILRGSDGQD